MPSALTASEVRAIIRAQHMRAGFFPGVPFFDPAWSMLLDLYLAAIERRPVSVSSLCIAAGVPATTALSRISELRDIGLFEREDDPEDKRRTLVKLSTDGVERMDAYFTAVTGARS